MKANAALRGLLADGHRALSCWQRHPYRDDGCRRLAVAQVAQEEKAKNRGNALCVESFRFDVGLRLFFSARPLPEKPGRPGWTPTSWSARPHLRFPALALPG